MQTICRSITNFAFVAAAALCGIPMANAWDDCGHKTVAAYAYNLLKPETKAKVDALFAADPRGRHFVDAATWPDDIKRGLRNDLNPKAPLDKNWHFVDIPYEATGAEVETEVNKPGVQVDPNVESSANVVTAIRFFKDKLAGGQGDPVSRADALSWLIHLVGDVHQPLHCVSVFVPLLNYTPPAKGDEGGNGFAIHHPAKELHALWDDMFDEPSGGRHEDGRDSSDENAAAIAKDLRLRITLKDTDINVSEPENWAKESYSLRQFVYSPMIAPHATAANPAHTITPEYLAQGRTEAEKRVSLAGARLAMTVEAIFAAQ